MQGCTTCLSLLSLLSIVRPFRREILTIFFLRRASNITSTYYVTGCNITFGNNIGLDVDKLILQTKNP